MKLTPDHPWAVDVCGTLCMHVGADDRKRLIRESTDIEWLEKVKSPAVTNHLTVREAARRRIKRLLKGAA